MQPVINMEKIYKTYPGGIVALQGADFSLNKGEIHALAGENAAGKSTLMNILYGMVKPDNGNIYINGEKKNIHYPKDAINYGIGMVHQHFMLVPDFTVLENIMIGNESPFTGHAWKINFEMAEKAVRVLLKQLGMNLDLYKKVNELPIGLQQKVEILKVLFKGATILIFDEPTTVLAPNEVEGFLNFLKKLRSEGKTIVFISHRLKEVFSIADRITVLRRGKEVSTLKTKKTSMEDVSNLMIGRRLGSLKTKNHTISKEKLLELKKVSLSNEISILKNVSFNIKRREILGIAGVEGNGQSELADIIAGLRRNTGGGIWLDSENINNFSIMERRKKGIGYISEDRIEVGLSLEASIVENSIMSYQRKDFIKDGNFSLNWEKAAKFAQKIIKEYGVQGMSSPLDKISSLSGGNMQKLMVGREFISFPQLLIVSQLTRGLDVGAQFLIHQKIVELSKKGAAILLISEDLDELMTLSDRILVLYRGEVVKEFFAEEGYKDKEIGFYMTGVKSVV